jgi:hypothetical protein
MDPIPNLQTLGLIQTIENLFHDVRYSESAEEDVLLSYYHKIQELLNHTFNLPNMVLVWNLDDEETVQETITRRKKVMRRLDVSFHKLYRKLMEAFQKVVVTYQEISPGIDKVFVYSLPSVKILVESYIKKSVKLQKSLYYESLFQME